MEKLINKNTLVKVVYLLLFLLVSLLFWLQFEQHKKLIIIEEMVSGNEKNIKTINEFNAKSKEAIINIATALVDKDKVTVNLTSQALQDIGKGFMVGKIELTQHLTGVKISGVVINATSLNHESATFKIKIGDSEQSFTVNTIRSGASTQFSAYLPGIKLENTNTGIIAYETSMVSYGR